MSIAHLTSPRTTAYVAPAETPAIHPAPLSAAPAVSHIRAVPVGTEARGFVVYVGIDEEKAEADGTSLGSIVSQIKALVAQLAPSSETYAAVALAPRGSGGRDVEVVRLALQDPAALAKHRQSTEPEADPSDRARDGVVVDLSRKRVLLDNEAANLTYKEFELLQYLVLREGRTIERAELISSLWGAGHEDLDDIPNERTIDVHVRRLRAKLGDYEDIVRTVRGVGYRFDRHADVSVRQTSTPSPDLI
ncbi:transcriptional regulator [Subtercola boreus]|uniref:Transcriptional regulator n=1 Tax=Subtercola boreus TaxID=120213 RepID=A0A3E0W5L8_9MICO|nr:winged helix-turn-helix domain-containing protein [Subtercola boreus]RFA17095.1 transcriptional regulator [Subtercola boreus]